MTTNALETAAFNSGLADGRFTFKQAPNVDGIALDPRWQAKAVKAYHAGIDFARVGLTVEKEIK